MFFKKKTAAVNRRPTYGKDFEGTKVISVGLYVRPRDVEGAIPYNIPRILCEQGLLPIRKFWGCRGDF
ncbi:MAG: hypothetical protein IJC26_07885, partial [Clostridia bacterium]|nr:hypothetical protein [Clostridia bacterium]